MSIQSYFAFFILTLANPIYAETATVTKVLDGDTIDVVWNDQTTSRIRMAGIDAPEHNQVFGEECKDALSKTVLNKQVDIKAYAGQVTYGRQVATVFIKGQDVNLQQIKKGCAWVYKKYLKTLPKEYWGEYLRSEYQAKSSKTGLWNDPNPINPADFRHMQ